MRSARVSLARVRRAWRLIGDARALRHRPADRESVLVDGLCRLFGGDNDFHLAMEDYRPAGRVEAKALVYGSVVDPYPDRWLNCRLGVETTLTEDVMVAFSIGRTARTTVLTQRRLMERIRLPEWPVYAEAVSTYGLSDNLVFVLRPGTTHDMRAYATHRRGHGAAFDAADQGLAKLVAAELRRQIDPVPPRPVTAGLANRPAEVLAHLLRGEAPKAIAAELGIAEYTVRDHVKTLLRHFRVHSIQELVAKLR